MLALRDVRSKTEGPRRDDEIAPIASFTIELAGKPSGMFMLSNLSYGCDIASLAERRVRRYGFSSVYSHTLGYPIVPVSCSNQGSNMNTFRGEDERRGDYSYLPLFEASILEYIASNVEPVLTSARAYFLGSIIRISACGSTTCFVVLRSRSLF